MKVLYVNTLYSPNIGGGAEITLGSIVNGFRLRGQDAGVLTTHGGKGALRERVEGVPVCRLGERNIYWHYPLQSRGALARAAWHAIDCYNPLMARDVGRVLDKSRPDIMVCHNLAGISASVWAEAEKRDIPIVQVLHDYYNLCPKSTMFRDGKACGSPCGGCTAFRLPHRRASRAVSAVIGVSRAVLDTHLDNGLFDKALIKAVIHNARNIPPQPQRRHDPGKPFTFGFIGSLTPVKGVDLLAQAFAEVSRLSARPVRLMIAGTGKDSEVLRLKRQFSSKQVRFVGHVNPYEFFPLLDASVVPSLWHDPFPGVVQESLGLGVPVIGSWRGGIPEMVRHQVNGLLFDPVIPGALEAAMSRMVDDTELYLGMRARARESAAELLDPKRVLDQYEAVFNDLIELQRPKDAGNAFQLPPTTRPGGTAFAVIDR